MRLVVRALLPSWVGPTLMGLLLGAPARAATPFAGLEWRPLSRGDLTFVDEGDTTGLLVGELDGFARPQLLAYVGAWGTNHLGADVSLGVARLTTTSRVGDTWTQRHWGVFRPGLDVRAALLSREDPRPNPWLLLGGHVDIPSARDTSNGYTEDEREAANEAATIDRIRLASIGWRAGAGVDLRLWSFLGVGMLATVEGNRSLYQTSDPTAISSWITGQGALLLEFHWPALPRGDGDGDSGSDGDGEDDESGVRES